MYLSRKLCLVMFPWDKCWVITPFHCYRSLHFRLLTRNTRWINNVEDDLRKLGGNDGERKH